MKGYSTLGIVFLLFICVSVLLAFSRIAPLYYENYLIKHLLDQMDTELFIQDLSSQEIRQRIQKVMKVNNISENARKALKVEIQSKVVLIEVNYELRTPLAFNLDIILKFNNRREKKIQ